MEMIENLLTVFSVIGVYVILFAGAVYIANILAGMIKF
jgi:hypothetical protein